MAPNSPKLFMSIDTTKPSALIIDLIAAIRAMTKIPETYKQLAWKFLAALPKEYCRIDLVADTHRDIFIKRCKVLDRRTSTRIMISSPASRIPSEFSKYIKSGENNPRLIDLICEVILTDYKKALKMLKCKEIYFSKEDGCFLFNENGFHSGTYLNSNHKEADSKVRLHCLDALKEPEATVVLRPPSGDSYSGACSIADLFKSRKGIY